MAARKRRHVNRKSRKRARKNAARKSLKAAIRAAQAAAGNGATRPRVKLPEAMRVLGLDEYAIAQCFAEQIQQILNPDKQKRISRKLLLDFLKECVRIIYAPARRGDAPVQPTSIELVHFVPRPDRSGEKPAGEPLPGEASRPAASDSQVPQATIFTEEK